MAAGEENGASQQAANMSEFSQAALLVVLGEPFSTDQKELILKRVTKALQCWDVEETGVDINEELTSLANAAPTGTDGPNEEKIISHGSDKLQVDILVQPQLSTCIKGLRQFLLSPAKHHFLLYAGQAFQGTGDWILQDDVFTFEKFASICKESDVENALKQLEGGSLVVHTFAEGAWNNGTVGKLNIAKLINIKVNPDEKLNEFNGILQFSAYISYFLNPQNTKNLLQVSDFIGNIRFSRPTVYIFPGCQGDSAFFGITGFNLLINGGYSRKPCFWDFSRHLDRIDALLLTHLSPDNIFGASSFLERKAQENVHPEIGYVFMNSVDKVKNIPNGESDEGSGQSLLVNLVDEGNKMVKNLRNIGNSPHPCIGQLQGQNLQPLTLYSKVGYGTLEMYVLNPLQDSKEVKEFLSQWSKQVDTFSSSKSKLGGRDVNLPLPNVVSVSALLVWSPSNPSESITRILLPGNAPQHKIFEGLDKLKTMGIFQQASCCQEDLNTPKPAAKAKPAGNKPVASKPPAALNKTLNTTISSSPSKPERKPPAAPAAADKKPAAKAAAPAKVPAKTSKDEKNKKAAAGKEKSSGSSSPRKSPVASSPSSSKSRTPPAHSTPEPSPSEETKCVDDSSSPEFAKEINSKPESAEKLALEAEKVCEVEAVPPQESPVAKPPTPVEIRPKPEPEPVTEEEPLVSLQSAPQESAPIKEEPLGSPEPLLDPVLYETKAESMVTKHAHEESLKDEEGPISPPPSPVEELEISKSEHDNVAAEPPAPVDLDQADTAPISSPESEASQIDALTSDAQPSADAGTAGQQDLFDLGIYDDEAPATDQLPHSGLSRSQHEEVLKASQMTSSIYEPSDPMEAGASDMLEPEALQSENTASPDDQHPAPEVDQVFGGASPEGLPEPVTPEDHLSPQELHVAADEALMMSKNPFMYSEDHTVPAQYAPSDVTDESAPQASSPEQEASPVSMEQVAPESPEVCPESMEQVAPESPGASPLSMEKVAPESPEDFPLSEEQVAPESPEVCPVSVDQVAPESPEASPLSKEQVAPESPEASPLSKEQVAPESPLASPLLPEEAAPESQETSTEQFAPASPEQIRHPDSIEEIAPSLPEMPVEEEIKPVEAPADVHAEPPMDMPQEPELAAPEQAKQRSVSPEEQRDSRSESQEPPDSLTGSYSEEQVYRTSRPDEVASLVEEEGYDDFFGMEAERFMQNQDQAVPQNPFNLVDGPMECGIADPSPDQAINPFLGVGGDDIPPPSNDMFGIPAAPEGALPEQANLFAAPAEHEHHEHPNERDSLEREFDPLQSWGQPMGLPAPPPPNPDSNIENKKPAPKKSPGTPGSASKKPAEAKKAAAGRLSMGGKTTLKKDIKDGGDKKQENEKKDAEKKKPAAAPPKTTPAPKAATKKPPSVEKLNGSMREAPKKTTTVTKARPATAPAAKAKPAPAATKRPATARAETPAKSATPTPVVPFYVELTYVPCHGDTNYCDIDFFRRVRARYYVVSALNPSPSVFNALLEAKQTWDSQDSEVTIIPTHDTETLRHWMGLHREQLSQLKINVAPSANRCTIQLQQLQDLETSCAAYRLEF